MDWIKQHYEKMVLALMLVLLIASAVTLSIKIGRLNQEVREAPRRAKPKGNLTKPTNLGSYSNVLVQLHDPPLWTNSDRGLTEYGPIQQTGQNPIDSVTNVTSKLPALQQVFYSPFKLLFKAYSGYSGEPRNFQLNFLTWNKSFLVSKVDDEVADHFSTTAYTTGYFIKKFEQKKVPATGGASGDQDVSELTLQHEGEDAIVLVYNKVTASKEPIARIVCPGSTQSQDVGRSRPFRCGDTTYNVVDITPNQMIIKDMKSGDQMTIPLSRK